MYSLTNARNFGRNLCLLFEFCLVSEGAKSFPSSHAKLKQIITDYVKQFNKPAICKKGWKEAFSSSKPGFQARQDCSAWHIQWCIATWSLLFFSSSGGVFFPCLELSHLLWSDTKLLLDEIATKLNKLSFESGVGRVYFTHVSTCKRNFDWLLWFSIIESISLFETAETSKLLTSDYSFDLDKEF